MYFRILDRSRGPALHRRWSLQVRDHLIDLLRRDTSLERKHLTFNKATVLRSTTQLLRL